MKRSNPAATWKARGRSRRCGPAGPTVVNARDVGIREGVGRALRFEDDAPDWRRSAWLWFQRDPETGLLPFGVF